MLYSEFRTEDAYQAYLSAASERDCGAGRTPLEGLAEEIMREVFA